MRDKITEEKLIKLKERIDNLKREGELKQELQDLKEKLKKNPLRRESPLSFRVKNNIKKELLLRAYKKKLTISEYLNKIVLKELKGGLKNNAY